MTLHMYLVHDRLDRVLLTQAGAEADPLRAGNQFPDEKHRERVTGSPCLQSISVTNLNSIQSCL